jgi:hypothetical protein
MVTIQRRDNGFWDIWINGSMVRGGFYTYDQAVAVAWADYGYRGGQ